MPYGHSQDQPLPMLWADLAKRGIILATGRRKPHSRHYRHLLSIFVKEMAKLHN
jgi:hypothetical protein